MMLKKAEREEFLLPRKKSSFKIQVKSVALKASLSYPGDFKWVLDTYLRLEGFNSSGMMQARTWR